MDELPDGSKLTLLHHGDSRPVSLRWAGLFVRPPKSQNNSGDDLDQNPRVVERIQARSTTCPVVVVFGDQSL